MSSTPVFPMPAGEPSDDDDPLGIDEASAEEQEQAAEAEHEEEEPNVITLDEVEEATEGNDD